MEKFSEWLNGFDENSAMLNKIFVPQTMLLIINDDMREKTDDSILSLGDMGLVGAIDISSYKKFSEERPRFSEKFKDYYATKWMQEQPHSLIVHITKENEECQGKD